MCCALGPSQGRRGGGVGRLRAKVAAREWPVATDCCRSALERGGGPPKVVEGHGRSRVTYKGHETPHVPLHHASHGPPPPVGEERQLTTPLGTSARGPPSPTACLPQRNICGAAPLVGQEARPYASGKTRRYPMGAFTEKTKSLPNAAAGKEKQGTGKGH